MQTQLPYLEQTENKARLRLDIHLYLFYWHARLYLGRPFLFEHPQAVRPTTTMHEHAPAGLLFAQDAIDASFTVVGLCQTIHDQIGLSQASYVTEFTSCRAAMLVLIAVGITDKSSKLRDMLAQGLQLIQLMSAGQGTASSETRVIAALQRAITRLHGRPTLMGDDALADSASNEHIKEWELLWQAQSPNNATAAADDELYRQEKSLDLDPEPLPAADLVNHDASFDMWSAVFSNQLDEFSLFPAGDGYEENGFPMR